MLPEHRFAGFVQLSVPGALGVEKPLSSKSSGSRGSVASTKGGMKPRMSRLPWERVESNGIWQERHSQGGYGEEVS